MWRIKGNHDPIQSILLLSGHEGCLLGISSLKILFSLYQRLKQDSLKQSSGEIWQTVTMQQSYTNPVVLAQILTNNDMKPAHTRLKNIQANSFQVQIEEWDYRLYGQAPGRRRK